LCTWCVVGKSEVDVNTLLDFWAVGAACVVLMASGAGSLAQSVMDAAEAGTFTVVALVTDQSQALVVQRALDAGVAVHIVPVSDFASRAEWDSRVADVLSALSPDLIVSAGFMRVLGAAVVDRFAGRIINTHPSLLPLFSGSHAVADALAAGTTRTGATVHFVDHGVDTGPVIAQVEVAVQPNDTVDSLHERIKVVERKLIVDVIKSLASGVSEGKADE